MNDIEKTLQELIEEGCEKHRRYKVRIAERTHYNLTDTCIFAEMLYTVKVQVKRFGFWLTVWSETCNNDDSETALLYKICAEEVYDKLTETI